MSKQNEIETVGNNVHYYHDKKGSLYKIAKERDWNAYQFDVIKRIDRCERKGEFESDIDKTIEVLKMYKFNK